MIDPEKKYKMNLYELETLAKHSRNPKHLHAIAVEHYKNEVICWYVAGNIHCDEETLVLLASHPHEQVRMKVAEYCNMITSNKVLVRLALDTVKVRETLAQRTLNQDLLKLLFRGNPNNECIMKSCLKEISDMQKISSFILNSSAGKLFDYADAILDNAYLTDVELKAFIASVQNLHIRHIEKIRNHRSCTKDVLSELIEKMLEKGFVLR